MSFKHASELEKSEKYSDGLKEILKAREFYPQDSEYFENKRMYIILLMRNKKLPDARK